MLTRMPSLELLRHNLRVAICPQCFRRPEQGKETDVATAEPCERTCPVFTELPHLKAMAERLDPMIKPVDEQLHQEIVALCHRRLAAQGSYKGAFRNFPLHRYARRISREIGRQYR